MKRREVYMCKELSLSEKHLFMWFKDYQKKHKTISLSHVDIAKAIASDRRNMQRTLNFLIKKGFVKRTKINAYKSNSFCYKILK